MKKVFLILLVGLFLVTGCSVKKIADVTDAEKFAKEYSVSDNNPFEYINIDEVLDIIEHKSGIILFGNSDCEWCNVCATLLTKSLKYKGVEKAYYYNPKKIKEKNTKKYKKLVNLLKDYLEEDENGKKTLLLPDVYFIKNGKIISHNNDLSTIATTPDKYLTSKRKKQITNKFNELISKYNVKECTTC